MQEVSNIPTTVLNYGALGGGGTHRLSSVTTYLGVSTKSYSLAQWQTIFPSATALSNELS